MGLQVEIWHNFIMENFYADNPHLAVAANVSGDVLNGKVVHIPQAGTASGGEKNRTVFPAGIVTRGDTEVTYALDDFTTNPVRIPNIEQYELSYDKRKSILDNDRNFMSEFIGTDIFYKWANGLTGANLIRTTGSNIDATAPGATGSRKAFTRNELKKARAVISNSMKVVRTDSLYCFMPLSMIDSLSAELDKVFYLTDEEKRLGIVGKLDGFNIVPITTRLVADAAGAIKAVGAVAAATDNEVAVCISKDAVEFALGSMEVFSDEKNPVYFSDIFSFQQRYGGRRRRSDNAGVVNIVQVAP